MKKTSLLASLLFLVTGCGGPDVKDYADQSPKLDIRQFLNGDLEAWGTFYDWRGRAEPRFHVKMKGTWNGNEGTLAEDFTYADGRKQQREWKLRIVNDNQIEGTASDVVGVARGYQYGNTANMKYVLKLPVDGKTYEIAMDDWLYLVDETHLTNRTKMRKFGFPVGELQLAFRKIK